MFSLEEGRSQAGRATLVIKKPRDRCPVGQELPKTVLWKFPSGFLFAMPPLPFTHSCLLDFMSAVGLPRQDRWKHRGGNSALSVFLSFRWFCEADAREMDGIVHTSEELWSKSTRKRNFVDARFKIVYCCCIRRFSDRPSRGCRSLPSISLEYPLVCIL